MQNGEIEVCVEVTADFDANVELAGIELSFGGRTPPTRQPR